MTSLIDSQIPSSARCLGLTGLLALPEHSEFAPPQSLCACCVSTLSTLPPGAAMVCSPTPFTPLPKCDFQARPPLTMLITLSHYFHPWTSSMLIRTMNHSPCLSVCWPVCLHSKQGRAFLLFTAIPPGPTIKEEFFKNVLNLCENYWINKSSGSLLTISQTLHLIIRSNNYHLENSPKDRYYTKRVTHVVWFNPHSKC